MTIPPPEPGDSPALQADASAIASSVLERADRDIAFVIRLVGESLHIVNQHFVCFIERELAKREVHYGDHPLLRPFVEMHARELTEFVVNGVSLQHQFGLKTLETLSGDPMRLLRVDLWDTLRSNIEHAERHFVSGAHGLQTILGEVEALQEAESKARARPTNRSAS